MRCSGIAVAVGWDLIRLRSTGRQYLTGTVLKWEQGAVAVLGLPRRFRELWA